MPSPTFLAAFAALLLVIVHAAWAARRYFLEKIASSFEAGRESGASEGELIAASALSEARRISADAERMASEAAEGSRSVREALEKANGLIERFRGPGGIQWSLVADRDQWRDNYAEMGRTMGNAQHQMLTFIEHLGKLVPKDRRPELPEVIRAAHRDFMKYANLAVPAKGVAAAEIPAAEYDEVVAQISNALGVPVPTGAPRVKPSPFVLTPQERVEVGVPVTEVERRPVKGSTAASKVVQVSDLPAQAQPPVQPARRA